MELEPDGFYIDTFDPDGSTIKVLAKVESCRFGEMFIIEKFTFDKHFHAGLMYLSITKDYGGRWVKLSEEAFWDHTDTKYQEMIESMDQ